MPFRRPQEQMEGVVRYRQPIGAPEYERAEGELQETLQSLIEAQERELANIARELHDDICQRLTLLSLRIERVTKGWESGQGQIGEQLQQIWEQCSELAGDVQALSRELHPSVLDNLGLVSALQGLCREVTEQSELRVEFTSQDVPEELPREVALSLFRVAQEALNNSLKYSGGAHTRVHLESGDERIELEVRDRGIGFDVARARMKGGLGLVGMRERIHLLNGTITIESKPGHGTTIRASVPLPMAAKAYAASAN